MTTKILKKVFARSLFRTETRNPIGNAGKLSWIIIYLKRIGYNMKLFLAGLATSVLIAAIGFATGIMYSMATFPFCMR